MIIVGNLIISAVFLIVFYIIVSLKCGERAKQDRIIVITCAVAALGALGIYLRA